MDSERWHKIEEIFHRAVEIAPDERAKFLDQACEGDWELRREVESLLAGEEDAQETLMSTVILAAAQSLSKDRPDEFVGRRIGAYRVTGIIGQGGMAEVFRAVRDDDQYQKQVAIKLIQRGMVSNFTLSRFRYERQILASLEHPNIARMLDGGATEDGLPYFVMEYIEGQPVTDYCKSNNLSVRERLNLFRAICEAVQYAHRNLVIHRDLKPSNILVTEDGTPKLLDFGIAKLLDPGGASGAVTVAKTMTTARLMTPDYASPEQVRGGSVTTATDIYSLGAVLYTLLTGQRPHRFKNLSLVEIERAICETEVERPSVVAGRQTDAPARLRRELVGDIDNIVMMAMRKEPERRYQSVEQLSEDIRRYLQGRTVRARQDTLVYRAGKFVRRHRLGVASAALLLVLLVGFSVTMAVQAARIARERDRANQVTEFLVEAFEVSDPNKARGNTVTAREILDKGADRIRQELRDQPEVQAALMDTMGRVYQNLGLYDSALPLLEEALRIRRQTLGEDDPQVATSINNLAWLLENKGDYGAAEPLYRDALERRRRLFGDEHTDVASSLNNLALLLYRKGDHDGAEPLYRQSLAMRQKLLGQEHPEVASSLNNLALVLQATGRNQEAEQMFRQSLDMRRRLLGEDHMHVAIGLNNLALALYNQNNFEAAEPLFRETLALRRKLLGEEHPEVSESLNNLASLLYRKGDHAAAEPVFRQVLEVDRKLLGEKHPYVANTLNNLAHILMARADYKAAEPLFVEALGIYESSLGPNHWLVAQCQSNYGDCLTRLARYREAEEKLLGGYAGLKTAFGEDHERTRAASNRLVSLYETWGRKGEAERYRSLVRPQEAQ